MNALHHITNLCFTLFLISLNNFTKSETLLNSEYLKKNVPGFFCNMPKMLFSGKNETVCLSLHQVHSFPVQVVIDLKLRDRHTITNRFVDSVSSCFPIHVPLIKKEEIQLITVKIQVKLNNITYSAHNLDPIAIYPSNKVTFVDTDRENYKPGDVVKIRILSLDRNLLPINGYHIPYISIKNPLGIGVTVWKNVSTNLGLTHLSYELSKESYLGDWKIEVDKDTKKFFKVKGYTLPRFKVSVLYPKVIYCKSSQISITICAKYSYGAVVKGSAFLRLGNIQYDIKPIQSLKNMTDGCAQFSYSSADLSIENIYEKKPIVDKSRINIFITATVTERGTDRIELTTAKIIVLSKPFNIKFTKNDMFFPGLPYHGALQLSNIHKELTGDVIEICYNLAVRKSWNYLNQEYCSNFILNDKEAINFQIAPLKNNIIHLQLTARSLNHTAIEDNLLVVRMFSPNYILIQEVEPSAILSCKAFHEFRIQYTTDKMKEDEIVTFYYIIKIRNQIYSMHNIEQAVEQSRENNVNDENKTLKANHKYTSNHKPTNEFLLKFKIEEGIISNYQLLIYYISKEGDVISAAKEIKVHSCLNNEVKVNWSHKQIFPGSIASLLIETKDSLCSVTAIDKATIFMNGGNTLNAKSLLKDSFKEKELPEVKHKTCVPPTKFTTKTENNKVQVNSQRSKRHVYTYAEDYDVYDVFHKFGFVTISNFKVITKPCYTGPLPPTNNPAQILTEQYDIPNDDNTAGIRYFFPETWLWELVPVRNAAVIHRNLPHTISTWVTNVLCVSATHGPGFSQIAEITAFQPFFVDVLTPYSIKIGETLYLHATVFNYLTYHIPVKIMLRTTDGLTLRSKSYYSYCVFSNNTVTHIFELTAVKIQQGNITVTTELDPSYPGHCGPDILINKSDIVLKSILIQSEGFHSETTKSALLCGSEYDDLNEVSWEFSRPDDVILNTTSTKIIFSGDIFDQTIQNLNNLLTMPTGCGEQIMASLSPNINVLNYLNSTKSLTASTKHKILRNLKIGYQRILNYVHKDGSFSPFGYHDPSGSMFLTAFIVRVLQDIKKHIYVDQKIIDKAVTWIYNHQLENGCFNTMYHVFQDMGDATFENSTAGLTAYVIISLLESNISVPETVQTNAKYCIRGQYNLDKYTLAISSYALLKVEWYSEAQRMLKKLFQISNKKNNMIWWTNNELNGSLATDIEITSYVLLALLQRKTQENLANAHSIVQWLLTQQNSLGGFKSTQDTVVALDALTKYASFVKLKAINLKVSLTTDEKDYFFNTSEKHRLQSKQIKLKDTTSNIKINIEGEGCILAQARQSFFTKHVSASHIFKIDNEVMSISQIDKCSIATILSCFSYNGPYYQANMAVLEVDLPSGYKADRQTLYRLIEEDQTKKIKMFEELHEKVVFYLVKLDSQQVCVNFNINENVKIHNRTNSTIKLYDYYKPEYLIMKSYKINDVCKFSNLTNIAVNLEKRD